MPHVQLASRLSPLALTFVLFSAVGCSGAGHEDPPPDVDGGAALGSGSFDAAAPSADALALAASPDLGPMRPDGHAAAGSPATRGRLIVADGDPENPRLVVIDLDDGAVVARFPTLGTARVYSSGPWSGYAYATQAVPGLVEIFASGIRPAPGGGHVKEAPFALSTRLEGARPTHWVAHDHWVVSFNDGDGSFDYLLESSLGTSRTLMRRAHTGIGHHGVAVITHGNVIASHAIADPVDPTKTLRTGVTVRKLATPEVIVEAVGGCAGLHGEAANEEAIAFGCADGILLGERKEGRLLFRKLEQPEGRPVGTLRARAGLPRLIGNLRDATTGHDVGFFVVPYADAAPVWTPVAIGVRQLAFVFEPATGRLVVLGGDGALRIHDPMTGVALEAPLAVVPAYAAGAMPALAVGDQTAFVLDPRSGKVHEVELTGWRVGRVVEMGGQPVSAAAFGATKVVGP